MGKPQVLCISQCFEASGCIRDIGLPLWNSTDWQVLHGYCDIWLTDWLIAVLHRSSTSGALRQLSLYSQRVLSTVPCLLQVRWFWPDRRLIGGSNGQLVLDLCSVRLGELLSAVPLVCGHIGWSRLDVSNDALLAGMSLSLRRICPKRFQRTFRICSEKGFSWHFSYNDLFVIFIGNLIFRTFVSCFRWKAFIFSSSVRVSAHVLQLYSSMGFTRDL